MDATPIYNTRYALSIVVHIKDHITDFPDSESVNKRRCFKIMKVTRSHHQLFMFRACKPKRVMLCMCLT